MNPDEEGAKPRRWTPALWRPNAARPGGRPEPPVAPMRRSSDRVRRRWGFGPRLAATFALTLLVVGLVQFKLASKDIKERLVDDSKRIHTADAEYVRRAFLGAGPGEDPMAEAGEALRAIANRPGVGDVVLIDGYGDVEAASDPEELGTTEVSPNITDALRMRRTYAGPQQDSDEAEATPFEYVLPVSLPIGPHVLEINERSLVLDEQLADARRRVLRVTLLQFVIGLPLLYLLGGRSLTRRHRKAIEGSRRDPLTELGNHRAFQEELERAIQIAQRHPEPLTLAFIDIDEFKLVNDRRGHKHGDEVLTEVAKLIDSSRVEDLAFRIGGDEFTLILPRTEIDDAAMVVERIRAAVMKAHPGVTVSIGVAALGTGDNPSGYLKEHADAALYEAKRRGRNAVVKFHEIETIVAIVDPERVRALRRLLDSDGIGAAFQPIWDLDQNEVIGYEALARPPSGCGLDGPGEAFEIAEKIGHAHTLDNLCRKSILARAAELPDDALLFLNVSPQTLDHDSLRGEALKRQVEAAGLTPQRVVLEITERSGARLNVVIREARRLAGLGFKIALDDVGPGNAGLEMLRQLSVDFVKIDREIVSEAVSNLKARAVLGAIIGFARQTEAFVIAEGIETTEMIELVRTPLRYDVVKYVGAQGGQGYLLGRPSETIEVQPKANVRALVR